VPRRRGRMYLACIMGEDGKEMEDDQGKEQKMIDIHFLYLPWCRSMRVLNPDCVI